MYEGDELPVPSTDLKHSAAATSGHDLDILPPPTKQPRLDDSTGTNNNDEQGQSNCDILQERNNNTHHLKLPVSRFDNMMSKIDSIKETVDTLKGKILRDIAKPEDVAPVRNHIEKLLMCRDLDEILVEFPELAYDSTQQMLTCELCYPKERDRAGGSRIPGHFS